MTHTILLVQTGEAETRVYSDFESVNECMEGICRIFEVKFEFIDAVAFGV